MKNLNFYGIRSIFIFNIKIFFTEYQSTIISPIVSTMLFVIVLSTIGKSFNIFFDGSSYTDFIIPGMIIISIIQTSFQNISETIINMKQIGSFNDFLSSPLSRIEILTSFLFSSIFIGLSVAFINIFLFSFFTDFYSFSSILYQILYLIFTILLFSSIGALTGFLTYSWDIQNSVSNFFIVPISFLSGTFFSINAVNVKWKFLFEYNPFYWLIKSFRESYMGIYNFNFYNCVFIFIFVLISVVISYFIFHKGYKVIY